MTDRGKSRSCERAEARRGKILDVSDRGATKARDANPRLPDGSQTVRCSSILVLGVGNLLLRDEGLGIHAVRGLEETFDVSPNVRILDGGTAGVGLLEAILGCDRLIVCDVARMNAPAGTVARLSGEALTTCFAEKQSAHDWSLCEVLLQARLLGHEPSTVVVAVEPADMEAWDMELSPTLAKRLPEVVSSLADEIRTAGGTATPRQLPVSLPR